MQGNPQRALEIKQLNILNFKNHAERNLEFRSGINAFCGFNGTGKTNILDAIYCLCHTKSFLNPADTQLIQFDAPYFLLQAKVQKEDSDHKISLGLKRGQKKQLKRNNKTIDRFYEYIGFLPAVMVAPTDRDLIHEGSEHRRKFFDGIISSYDNTYLEELLQYQQAVKNRNAVLKSMWEKRDKNPMYLEVWNDKLQALTEKLLPKRLELIGNFLPVFSKLYKEISRVDEDIHLDYQQSISSQGLLHDLENSLEKDLRLGYTSVGLHKDDMLFLLNGKPIKKYGSQGQQKTLLLALKLAHYQILATQANTKPLLLLDDIFDKLDSNRVSYLLQLINEDTFGQIFLTHTGAEDLERILDSAQLEAKIFTL